MCNIIDMENKKIAIITLFGYSNYGNRLQMFATQEVYKKMGFNTVILKHKQKDKVSFIWRLKRPLYLLFNFKTLILKNKRERNFIINANKYFDETKEYLLTNNIEKNNEIGRKYDFFSIGSDQIWNPACIKNEYFSLVKFASKNKIITFSPSFAVNEIPNELKESFKSGLQNIANISVREQSGAEIVKKLTGRDATVLVDPTLCLSKEEWLKFSEESKYKPKTKYILTYFLGEIPKKANDILSDFSKEYKIVKLNDFNSKEYYSINPSEWVDFINNASLFLTDSFHGVVFSNMLKTPFIIYNRVGGMSMNSRITNILQLLNKENRLELSKESPDLFLGDFTNVDEILSMERKKVFDHLKKSINKVGNINESK